jgi:arylsulfatase
MTGRYAIRSGNGTVPMGEGVYGLVQWEVTMAEMLADAGYATGMFGKWHLGRTEGRFPTDQGFDEWYGVPNSTDESVYSSLQDFAESGVAETYIMEGRKGSAPGSSLSAGLPAADRSRPDRQGDQFHAAAGEGRQAVLRLPAVYGHAFSDHASSRLCRQIRQWALG